MACARSKVTPEGVALARSGSRELTRLAAARKFACRGCLARVWADSDEADMQQQSIRPQNDQQGSAGGPESQAWPSVVCVSIFS